MTTLFVLLHVLSAIRLYLLPARRRRDEAVATAPDRGQITPGLQAGLDDRGVLACRAIELVVVVVITV
jgi:hypothetical protein